jgi:hypothetical protein
LAGVSSSLNLLLVCEYDRDTSFDWDDGDFVSWNLDTVGPFSRLFLAPEKEAVWFSLLPMVYSLMFSVTGDKNDLIF